MKINPTSSCLSLVLHAIDNAVLPEVSSGSAKATLGLIHTTLTDLLKRQGPSIKLLRHCNEEGETIRREALRLLGGSTSLHDTWKSFEELSADHDALTKDLNKICVRLSARNDPAAAQMLRRAAKWELIYASL